jgi:hypothetical protein
MELLRAALMERVFPSPEEEVVTVDEAEKPENVVETEVVGDGGPGR